MVSKKKWQDGYTDGWNSQGITQVSVPTILERQKNPDDVENPDQWHMTSVVGVASLID